jgi:hypothetical protein
MKSCPRLARICVTLVLISQIILLPPSHAATPKITGSYKITENTDLGTQVRITLEISFVNPSTTPITITRVGLPSGSVPAQLVTATSNLVVHSHASSQVSLQFLMSKKDFNAWHVASHQLFLITLEPSGGKPALINLPLLRTQG